MDILHAFSFWLFQVAYTCSPNTYTCFLVSIYLCFSIVDIYLGAEILDVFILSFVDTSKQFSKVIVPFYRPACNMYEFKLFHICTNTWHFSFFFKLAILMSIQRYNIMVLIFISLMTNEMEHHFIYWPFGCCLLKCLFKSLAHFSVGLYLPFSHLFVGSFYIYSMWVFCQLYILPVPSLWLLFHHLNGDFWWTEILYFNVVQFTYLPFLLGAFCILFVKTLPTPRSSRYSSIFSTNLGL